MWGKGSCVRDKIVGKGDVGNWDGLLMLGNVSWGCVVVGEISCGRDRSWVGGFGADGYLVVRFRLTQAHRANLKIITHFHFLYSGHIHHVDMIAVKSTETAIMQNPISNCADTGFHSGAEFCWMFLGWCVGVNGYLIVRFWGVSWWFAILLDTDWDGVWGWTGYWDSVLVWEIV